MAQTRAPRDVDEGLRHSPDDRLPCPLDRSVNCRTAHRRPFSFGGQSQAHPLRGHTLCPPPPPARRWWRAHAFRAAMLTAG